LTPTARFLFIFTSSIPFVGVGGVSIAMAYLSGRLMVLIELLAG
jgi:hypothetical protein